MTVQRFGSLPTDAIIPTAADISWSDFTPVFTGFSVDPTGVFRFCAFGDTVIIVVTMSTPGTSDSTIFEMTMPIASVAPGDTFGLISSYTDNGQVGNPPGMLILPAASAVLELFTNSNQANWKAMNSKSAHFTFLYERAFASPTF